MYNYIFSIMRKIIFTLFLMVGIFFLNCSADPVVETPSGDHETLSQEVILTALSSEVNNHLERIDSSLKEASQSLGNSSLNDSVADAALKDLYELVPYVTDTITLSSEGVILAVYPENYTHLIGENVQDMEHIQTFLTSKKPVLSPVFITIEGFPAIDVIHPVYSYEDEFMGGVTLLMDEKEFFKDLIAAVDPDSIFEIFVMENDGTIVYDSNISQIGENTFESPLFQDYPEILDLGQKMGNTTQGDGEYEYYNSDGMLVRKKALWDTVSLYGTGWIIVVSEEVDPVI